MDRRIFVGVDSQLKNLQQGYLHNKVRTSKYTIITFLPRNLYEQFKRISNIYFLFITCLTLIPGVSPTSPVTSVLPLLFVLGLTALKEAYEDLKRHQEDQRVNHQQAYVFRNSQWETISWQDIHVGQILKINLDEEIPADVILLSCSDEDGIALIETANLDGETNLKQRQALEPTSHLKTEDDILRFFLEESIIECEPPSTNLLKFRGKITIGNQEYPLSLKQALFRGCRLKNIEWAIGAVIYTGKDTKVRQNSEKPHYKMSSFEKQINRVMLVLFSLYTIFVFVSVLTLVLERPYDHWYLEISESNRKFILSGLATFIILYAQVVPISLFVSMDLVKLILSYFIWQDLEMYDENSGSRAIARNFSLVEELGRIRYIFADKTGTLTVNQMNFKKCSVNGTIYEDSFDNKELKGFWTLISLCHTVIPELGKNNEITYRATSEDERALVTAARQCGYNYTGKKRSNVTVNIGGSDVQYEVLATLEFDSDRKRMSVIVQDSKGKIVLYCKGADNAMLDHLAEGEEEMKDTVRQHLKTFASQGYRTLVMAKRELSREEFNSWMEDYDQAQLEIESREERLREVMDQMECNMTLVGASAIEDKLQDKVPEVMRNLAIAGIKIWVLTGDKLETAINVGYSTNLLNSSMKIYEVTGTDIQSVKSQILGALNEINENEDRRCGFVVDGKALGICLSSFPDQLHQIARKSSAVIIARISPLQKAQIVHLVKNREYGSRILAIGDGANDVSMIQEADVGVGISGREGMQAAMASDYSIGQFKFLQRLLFTHGRWGYKRLSKLVLYSFYKNILFIAVQFWFVFWSRGSGQTIYESWSIAMFNTLFAFLPIILLAILDQDVKAESVDKYPQLYQAGISNREFTYWRFFGWVLDGFFGSVVIFFGIMFTFKDGQVHPNGLIYDLWCTGTTMYTAALVAVTLKVLLETNYLTLWNGLSMIGSFLAWFVFMELFYIIPGGYFILDNSNMYGVATMLFRLPLFWICILFFPIVALIPSFTGKYLKGLLFPENFYIVREIEKKGEPSNLSTLESSPLLLSPQHRHAPQPLTRVQITSV